MGEGRQTLPQLIFVFLDSREVLPMYLIFSTGAVALVSNR